MLVRDVMTPAPASCLPESLLREVAELMVEHDCGAIPVAEAASGKVVGIVTDRDIVSRTLAKGRNPLELHARDSMSSPVVTVAPETDAKVCTDLMAQHQVRRMPVVDGDGRCCGIVAQADVARKTDEEMKAELVETVSEPNSEASRAPARS